MATQKVVEEQLKAWGEATSFKKATEHAARCVEEFDGLYEESARNLLARRPDLMMLLSAFQAGKLKGQPGHVPQEGVLGV